MTNSIARNCSARVKHGPQPFGVLSCRTSFSEITNFVESKRDISNSNKHVSSTNISVLSLIIYRCDYKTCEAAIANVS